MGIVMTLGWALLECANGGVVEIVSISFVKIKKSLILSKCFSVEMCIYFKQPENLAVYAR